ncbi:MAG: hypothetical protein ACTHMD_06775 [Flavisolibacter sp.]
MNYETNALFSLTIALGAVAGWARVKKIDRSFFPFLLLTWTGLVNEIVSLALIYKGYPNVVNYNIYSLTEALLVVWQFKEWGLFGRKRGLFYTVLGFFALWWLYETFILSSLFYFNSYFIVGYSFVIVVMSIVTISEMLFYEDYRLLRNAKFLICMGFVVYFTYAVLVEAFWLFGLNQGKFFRIRIYELLAYINLFTNLIFAVAILWMPMKPRYTQPF